MRFDLYTSEDRAREAMAYYRSQQQKAYMSWCSGGALVASYIVVVMIGYFAPDYLFPPGSAVGDSTRGSGWWGILWDPLWSARSWVIGGIVFSVAWVLGAASAKIIAFYQGVFLGLLFGGLAALVSWGALSVLGITSNLIVPICIGSLVGLVYFLAGALGSFLPSP